MDPAVYETLCVWDIKRLITSPISRDQDVIAFSLDNPPLDRVDSYCFYTSATWTFYQFYVAAQRSGWKAGKLKLLWPADRCENRHALEWTAGSLPRPRSKRAFTVMLSGIKTDQWYFWDIRVGDKAPSLCLWNLESPFPADCVPYWRWWVSGTHTGITENLFPVHDPFYTGRYGRRLRSPGSWLLCGWKIVLTMQKRLLIRKLEMPECMKINGLIMRRTGS